MQTGLPFNCCRLELNIATLQDAFAATHLSLCSRSIASKYESLASSLT